MLAKSPQNFSNILGISPNIYAFNPSIAHWKDNLYLCSYRQFVRYPHLFQIGTTDTGITYNYTTDKFRDPNHPWFGKCSSLRWNHIPAFGGFSNTRIAIIQINPDDSVTLIQSKMYVENEIVQYIDGEDARLLQIKDNKFLLSCTNFFKDVVIKDSTTCTKCLLISTRIIEVFPASDHFQIIIHPETILCPNISSSIEKNWSFSLIDKDKPEPYISFSYGLYPIHTVFDVSLVNNKIECKNMNSVPKLTSSADNIFSRLVSFYGSKGIGHERFFVSVSTPTVQIDTNIFLGVGHIKFRHTPMSVYPNPSYLYQFCFDMYASSKTTHEIYIYMMFFYAFNITDGEILACSNMFIPPSKGTLCFPSGLTINNDQVILSYGDDDDKCMFLTFTTQEIKNLLNAENIVQKQAHEVLFYMIKKSENIVDMMT